MLPIAIAAPAIPIDVNPIPIYFKDSNAIAGSTGNTGSMFFTFLD
jgi:hypothetical protein